MLPARRNVSSTVIKRVAGDPRRVRIVVAEDDAALREAIVDALRVDGYDVIGVADGDELLRCVENAVPPISLVLSDIHMPRMNGLDALAATKALPDHVPVLLISGDRDPITHEAALKLGAVGVLVKPFDGADLRTAIAMLTQTPDGWTNAKKASFDFPKSG